MQTSGLNLLLAILPLLSDCLTVEQPLCDGNLRTKYCNASFGGDLHTGCRYCGVGPQCPSTKPSARGFKTRLDLKEEILQRHNLYRSVVRSGGTKLPPSKCLPELRWDDELSEIAQVWADQCAGVLYPPKTDFYPKLFHERGSQRMTSRFHVMPGVGQNIAWALTRTVNFTKIIDELWYRDVANLQPESIKDFQVDAKNRNVHLVTQMIWGKTTHVGCGWIQFPVQLGSNKFHRIYPEGEFENFFVCNYGVGGNVPGEPVYNTHCKEDTEDIANQDFLDTSDLNSKLDEVFANDNPVLKKTLKICLDALVCIHSKSISSCQLKEQSCLESIDPGNALINPSTYFQDAAGARTDVIQCSTEFIYCSLKQNPDCQSKMGDCFKDLGETETSRQVVTTTVQTANFSVTLDANSDSKSPSTTTVSSNFDFETTTIVLHNVQFEMTTSGPSSFMIMGKEKMEEEKTIHTETMKSTESQLIIPVIEAVLPRGDEDMKETNFIESTSVTNSTGGLRFGVSDLPEISSENSRTQESLESVSEKQLPPSASEQRKFVSGFPFPYDSSSNNKQFSQKDDANKESQHQVNPILTLEDETETSARKVIPSQTKTNQNTSNGLEISYNEKVLSPGLSFPISTPPSHMNPTSDQNLQDEIKELLPEKIKIAESELSFSTESEELETTTLSHSDMLAMIPLFDDPSTKGTQTSSNQTEEFIQINEESGDYIKSIAKEQESNPNLDPDSKTDINDSKVTTPASSEVTSVIDFLTTFKDKDDEDLMSQDVSDQSSSTSFRLALCLEGMDCDIESLRCSILHRECNAGLNINELPFQVRKKLSECSIDHILCNMESRENCQTIYERCILIVVPDTHLTTVNLNLGLTTESAHSDTEKLDPFFMLLALSKLNGSLGEKELAFLSNISSSILDSIGGSVGDIQVLQNSSSTDINHWLLHNDTLAIFHDLTAILPKSDDENDTALAYPNHMDFDLANSSLIFDPISLAFGNVNSNDAKILAKDIIRALVGKKVHICSSDRCSPDYVIDEDPDGHNITFPNEVDFLTNPDSSIQIQLSNCLDGGSCNDSPTCDAAQEKCIGKTNAERFPGVHKKQLCKCVVEFLLCILNNSTNSDSCEISVDSCLTLVILVNGVPEVEDEKEAMFTSTQRGLDVSGPYNVLESLAEKITNLAFEEENLAQNLTIKILNNFTEIDFENASVVAEKETNSIVLNSLTPGTNPKHHGRKIIIDTSDLAKESPIDRQKITQKRVENVLRHLTGYLNEASSTQRSHLPITMSATTAFEEFTSPFPPTIDWIDQELLDLNYTMNEKNLLRVVSSAVAELSDSSSNKPTKLVFIVEKTDSSFKPIIMIQMETYRSNLIVHLKISNETLNSTIFQLPFESVAQEGLVDVDKLELHLGQALFRTNDFEEIFSIVEVAEIISSLIELNSIKAVDLEMANFTTKLLFKNNTFILNSNEPFLKQDSAHLDLSNLSHFGNQEDLQKDGTVELIHNTLRKNIGIGSPDGLFANFTSVSLPSGPESNFNHSTSLLINYQETQTENKSEPLSNSEPTLNDHLAKLSPNGEEKLKIRVNSSSSESEILSSMLNIEAEKELGRGNFSEHNFPSMHNNSQEVKTAEFKSANSSLNASIILENATLRMGNPNSSKDCSETESKESNRNSSSSSGQLIGNEENILIVLSTEKPGSNDLGEETTPVQTTIDESEYLKTSESDAQIHKPDDLEGKGEQMSFINESAILNTSNFEIKPDESQNQEHLFPLDQETFSLEAAAKPNRTNQFVEEDPSNHVHSRNESIITDSVLNLNTEPSILTNETEKTPSQFPNVKHSSSLESNDGLVYEVDLTNVEEKRPVENTNFEDQPTTITSSILDSMSEKNSSPGPVTQTEAVLADPGQTGDAESTVLQKRLIFKNENKVPAEGFSSEESKTKPNELKPYQDSKLFEESTSLPSIGQTNNEEINQLEVETMESNSTNEHSESSTSNRFLKYETSTLSSRSKLESSEKNSTLSAPVQPSSKLQENFQTRKNLSLIDYSQSSKFSTIDSQTNFDANSDNSKTLANLENELGRLGNETPDIVENTDDSGRSRTGDEDYFGTISDEDNSIFDSRIYSPGGQSANIVRATVVEDLNFARSVRDSNIGIATISSITVGVISILLFGLLIFLALARRRQFRHDNSSMASPIVTPTQSRTTFSASPTMACETPSMLETYEGVSYINEAINTSSSLGSCLEPILPIDGHTTIVTSFDEFMSFPGENRKTYFSNLISSPSQSMHPPPSLLPNKVVSKTKDLNEQLNFLFARPPPSFHNPV